MSIHINQIVKSLLDKDNLEQCSLQELQSFADSNPHFGAAQLLLTKKIKSEKPDLYNEQLQKTFLFFHNPLWVEQLMNDTGNATIIAVPKENIEKKEVAAQAIDNNELAIADTQKVISNEQPTLSTVLTEEETNSLTTGPVTEEENEKLETEIPGLAAAALQLSAEPTDTSLSFEPYHTVDYFASQGIKITQAEKPQDKFDLQLKSFTDWLKVLRKTPVEAIAPNLTPILEKKVEQMAQNSLTEKEVITEAMAEVWAKQGNAQKAIELYTKLSLQEPAKSAYFAALIEDLKKTL